MDLIVMTEVEMGTIVEYCFRCDSSRMTIDIRSATSVEFRHEWQCIYEVFGVCRHCRRGLLFRACDKDYEAVRGLPVERRIAAFVHNEQSVEHLLEIERPINQSDNDHDTAPAHTPDHIAAAFDEGSRCLSIGCYNAATLMFRLCIDLASKPLLPEENASDSEGQPNRRQRRDLGLRLEWLFTNGRLPRDLESLATCVREDGNDAGHRGNLTQIDAEDVKDFCGVLLDRLFTEPARIRLATERREARRSPRS